jgi:hypothetical protein
MRSSATCASAPYIQVELTAELPRAFRSRRGSAGWFELIDQHAAALPGLQSPGCAAPIESDWFENQSVNVTTRVAAYVFANVLFVRPNVS